MDTSTNELQDILDALDSLQTRVQELSSDSGAIESVPAEPADTGPAADPNGREPDVASLPGAEGDAGVDAMALLSAGIAELATLAEPKAFPKFFVRLAARTGLRMLLLKKWTSGLQVFLEENIKVPPEARKKRSDGRAPIPTSSSDVFEAAAAEAAVYAGPVPVKHFPLDLTLMLGRGSRERQIVIVPLPSQGHWNTFVYLDADEAATKALAAAGILAQFALIRMQLLDKGTRAGQGRVAGILRTELQRRRQGRSRRTDVQAPAPEGTANGETSGQGTASSDGPLSTPPLAPGDTPEIDPFAVRQMPEPVAEPTRTTAMSDSRAADAVRVDVGVPGNAPEAAPGDHRADDDRPAAPARPAATGGRSRVTPEIVLRHSGELPALPKAACHIMAVIEDPRTTATKLESALAMDQALTAKVLRIANSPFYGAVREIKTVSEAIVRLGFIAIRNWTLVTAARSVFLAPGAGMLYQKIWRQSVMSAMAGQLVAQLVGRADPEAVFIGGLMQNIGQLVLARAHPELFQEILAESATSGRPYHEVEKEMLGFDHGALGALLIREWNLSQELEDAVRWHHDFAAEDARNAHVAAMIALGEEIALTSAAGEATPEPEDDGPAAPSAAAAFLGVSEQRIAALRARARELQIDPHFFS